MAVAGVDPNKVWDLKDLVVTGERIYAAQLRGLPPGERQGRAGDVPGARRLENRHGGRRREHIDIVLNGKPGTAMPPWTQLSDVDLAAVITYTRNGLGNKTGEAVQPAEIKAARK